MPLTHQCNFFLYLFKFSDDILKRNMYLSKQTKLFNPHLGNHSHQFDFINLLYFFDYDVSLLFCTVHDVRYEKIKPKFDAANLDDCKELRFHIPSNSDYFTR